MKTTDIEPELLDLRGTLFLFSLIRKNMHDPSEREHYYTHMFVDYILL